MLITVIAKHSIDDAINCVRLLGAQTDGFELRLDYLPSIHLDKLIEFRKSTQLPIIFTLRSTADGGQCKINESERLELLDKILIARPDYVDIEHHVAAHHLEKIHSQYPNINIIRSYHNFTETPENLANVLSDMQHSACAIYKLACQANSSLDSLRMLHLVKLYSKKINISAHCMGEKGQFSRIAGMILGNSFCYASTAEDSAVAPGCMTHNELNDIYHIRNVNKETMLYALLGDPVEQSVGHLFHNKQYLQRDLNARYVKIQVIQTELTEFFKLTTGLPFEGFSVTMPLKESVIQHLARPDFIAINTIKIVEGKLLGINADGVAAMDAIENLTTVQKKQVLILGAGGAAKSIASAAYSRGAKITIVNRTVEKALCLAKQVSGVGIGFDNLAELEIKQFDIIINTVSGKAGIVTDYVSQLGSLLAVATVFMDINYYQPNQVLLEQAHVKQAQIINGIEMFQCQALLQMDYWLE